MKINEITDASSYDVARLDKAKKGLARYGEDFYRTFSVLEVLVKLMKEQPDSGKIKEIIEQLPWKAKTFILKNIVKTMPDGSPNISYNPAPVEKPKPDNKFRIKPIKP